MKLISNLCNACTCTFIKPLNQQNLIAAIDYSLNVLYMFSSFFHIFKRSNTLVMQLHFSVYG